MRRIRLFSGLECLELIFVIRLISDTCPGSLYLFRNRFAALVLLLLI
jgi:hypothetical protein